MLETYVVHVTKKCNCNCLYCYESDKTSVYGWEEIRSLIDNFTKYNDKFNLEFLGGEPCLRMDLIEKIVEYTPSVDTFTITTNGTIVDDTLIKLMKKHSNVDWSASIDGHQWANNMRIFHDGTNTHDKVIKNLKILIDAGIPTDQICCHMTTHLYNVAYIFDSVKHLYDMGFRSIGVGTIESTMTIDEAYCNAFKSQMMKVSRYIHAGCFPHLCVGELEGLKPASDKRHYMYDESGKVIGESYGRVDDDILSQEIDGVKAVQVSSDLEDMIIGIRRFVYDYHQDYKRVYGCGTGRSGSKTLAKHIAYKEHYSTTHEALEIGWEFDDDQFDQIREFDSNQVASCNINFADRLLSETKCKFVCVRRDKKGFVDSFMDAHGVTEDSMWSEVQNPHQYPILEEGINILEGLDIYWDMYYSIAEGLEKKHKDFQIIEFDDLIKSDVPEVGENGNGFFDYGDKFVETLI